MNTANHVILVDAQDHAIGSEEKLKAHQLGLRHRAFSVFVFDLAQKKLLLQQRQHDKYHSGGLWTNTCCSHPRPGEDTLAAAERRLQEEIGLSIPLQHVGEFQYTAHFANGLTEHEYDHVFIGFTSLTEFNFDKNEIAQLRWIDVADLLIEVKRNPEKFTPWFAQALEQARIAIKND
jgi:diphosphomevalonate decarboxylase